MLKCSQEQDVIRCGQKHTCNMKLPSSDLFLNNSLFRGEAWESDLGFSFVWGLQEIESGGTAHGATGPRHAPNSALGCSSASSCGMQDVASCWSIPGHAGKAWGPLVTVRLK